MKKIVGGLLALAALAGCSNSGGTVEDRRVDIPDPPEHGIQFVLPEATVQPGEEKIYCWYITLPESQDVWVNEYQAYQGEGGHHVVGFVTMENEPDGTVIDCESPQSMAMWLPLLTPVTDGHMLLPEGYGTKMEAGAKLVFQSHYVNASSDPIRVADVVNIYYVDDEDVPGLTPAAPWGNTVLDFQIPAGETKTVAYECPVAQQMNLITLFGHMHDLGKAISIQVGPSGGAMDTIYEVMEWQPSFRDKAPLAEWPVETPLTIDAGEVMRVTCTWTNDTGEVAAFPREMCAALSWFYPGEQPVTCAGAPITP